MARFARSFDPVRGDPRFEKLLRDAPPKGAKPFPDQHKTGGDQPAGSGAKLQTRTLHAGLGNAGATRRRKAGQA